MSKTANWREEFDELYGSFKLCAEVNAKDRERLISFIESLLKKERKKAWKDGCQTGATDMLNFTKKKIESGESGKCDCCGKLRPIKMHNTCEDCL